MRKSSLNILFAEDFCTPLSTYLKIFTWSGGLQLGTFTSLLVNTGSNCRVTSLRFLVKIFCREDVFSVSCIKKNKVNLCWSMRALSTTWTHVIVKTEFYMLKPEFLICTYIREFWNELLPLNSKICFWDLNYKMTQAYVEKHIHTGLYNADYVLLR